MADQANNVNPDGHADYANAIAPAPNNRAINYHRKRAKHKATMKRQYVKNPRPGRYRYKYKYRRTSRNGRNYWVYLYHTPYGRYRKKARRYKRYKRKLSNFNRATYRRLINNLTPQQRKKLKRMLRRRLPGGKHYDGPALPSRKRGRSKSKKVVKRKKVVKKRKKLKKSPAPVSGYDSSATITDVDLPIGKRLIRRKATNRNYAPKKRQTTKKKRKTKKKRLATKKTGLIAG